MTLLDSELDASTHSPLHDHADYHSLGLYAPLDCFIDFLAHNVSAETPSEYRLKFDSVFNVPLQVNLANLLSDLSLRTASGNNLGLELSHSFMVLKEALDPVDRFHAALLLFNVLPVRQHVGVVRVELSHEGHIRFLLSLQVSAPPQGFLASEASRFGVF